MKPLPNTKVCDCATCGQVLVGLTNDQETLDLARLMNVPVLAGRIKDGERDAPLCDHCYMKQAARKHWAVA